MHGASLRDRKTFLMERKPPAKPSAEDVTRSGDPGVFPEPKCRNGMCVHAVFTLGDIEHARVMLKSHMKQAGFRNATLMTPHQVAWRVPDEICRLLVSEGINLKSVGALDANWVSLAEKILDDHVDRKREALTHFRAFEKAIGEIKK